MRLPDALLFSWQTLTKQGFKSLMLVIAIRIGVISVVLLTGLGEGGRQFVLNQFSSLGNKTLVMVPGKKETEGGLPPLTGQSNKPITVADAMKITQLATVDNVAPLVAGNVEVAIKNIGHQQDQTVANKDMGKLDVLTAGSNTEIFTILGMRFIAGDNFSKKVWQVATPQVVIGKTLKRQLFANQNAIGRWVRLADRRYQVIGVISAEGTNLGFDFNKMAVLPIHSAMTLFNVDSLLRVFIKTKHVSLLDITKSNVLKLMALNQGGEADVTIISQNALLTSFNQIMTALNLSVAAIGIISLVVAGILIMNVTLISVAQRTAEIGLLRAVGASKQDIRWLFLSEAAITAAIGALVGVIVSVILLKIARWQVPSVPFEAPLWSIVSGFLIAFLAALSFAWLPSKQAAETNIISALTGRKDDN